MLNIQLFCKTFRVEVLGFTLKQVSDLTNVPLKTLSAFEHGRSTNINHLGCYYHLCVSPEQCTQFIIGFHKALLIDTNNQYKVDHNV